MTDTARPRESGDPACSPSCGWIPAFAGMSGKVIAALLVFCASLTPALAQQQVKIGVGYGLAFLPVYICEDLKLIEKHGKEAHLDVKASYQRFMGAAPMQDAISSDAIDMGSFGTAPLLAAWQKAAGTPQQIFAVSGITSLPLVLLSDQPNEQSIADLKPADHIAIPTLTSPQMYLLEMQSEKIFGQYDHLRGQVVALSHADAISALVDGAAQMVTAYFSSPPFTQLALRDAKVHAMLDSSEVMSGKSSFLIMGATKAYIDAHPLMPQVVDKAMDEAARIIHDDPRRAAQIYLTHEPSGTLNGAAMEAVISEIKDEFGSAIYGVQTTADFMARHGELKTSPQSWKEIVAPALLNSPST
jgi:NitT/TauT family transport system substrate-binding protein